jgi:hypothetical protein
MPSCTNYNNNVSAIGASSHVFKNNGNAVIGRQTIDVIDIKYNIKEKSQVPAPGKYLAFSDFNQEMK